MGRADVVFLGKHEVARGLLSRQGLKFNSRPSMPMANDFVTKGMHIGLMPDGPKWSAGSRAIASVLNPRAVRRYEPIYDIQSRQLLWELLSTNDFTSRFSRYADSIVFSLAFGIRLKHDEAIMLEAHEISETAIQALSGIMLVDQFPILTYLPKFLSPWKRTADRLHETTLGLYTRLAMSGLKAKAWNWTKKIKESPDWNFTAPESTYLLGTLTDAGSEPTIMAMRHLVLASLLYPECTRQAQQELDSVVGAERLPSYEDIEKLPYTNAMILETLRWIPSAFLGMPHAGPENGVFNKYFNSPADIYYAEHPPHDYG
jgi:cytochrome P450